jgi:hypothetical protein
MLRIRRARRWDAQPANPASVLLASDGRRPISPGAVARAAALAADSPHPVAVVAVAKIHGSSFGLPNPGLMPTKAELRERTGWVDSAIDDLARRGVRADGQVATTRRAVKLLAKIARIRGVSTVVIDGTTATGLRRIVEGDVGAEICRRLRRAGGGATVEIIPPTGSD